MENKDYVCNKMVNKVYVYNKTVNKEYVYNKDKIIYNYTWCMVFVMILIRINSSGTSAILCD